MIKWCMALKLAVGSWVVVLGIAYLAYRCL